jgi:SEC-C motif-containing protein
MIIFAGSVGGHPQPEKRMSPAKKATVSKKTPAKPAAKKVAKPAAKKAAAKPAKSTAKPKSVAKASPKAKAPAPKTRAPAPKATVAESKPVASVKPVARPQQPAPPIVQAPVVEKCPCASGKPFAECCEPIIKGVRIADTAEALMRSRYSAYVKTEVDHVIKTTSPDQREGLDERATRAWSMHAKWHSLQIVSTEKGGPQDEDGTVEFIASYTEAGTFKTHHERGAFKKKDGQWYYVEGEMVKTKPVVRETPKVGRNDPCPCGSGKKYKKCHGLEQPAA